MATIPEPYYDWLPKNDPISTLPDYYIHTFPLLLPPYAIRIFLRLTVAAYEYSRQ